MVVLSLDPTNPFDRKSHTMHQVRDELPIDNEDQFKTISLPNLLFKIRDKLMCQ